MSTAYTPGLTVVPLLVVLFGSLLLVRAADEPGLQFLASVRARAVELRANDKPPASRGEWARRRTELRLRLQQAWGPWPVQPAPLNPRKLGEFKRDGYRVEKLIFQTLPDVWMTANAYVPDQPGRRPAVLAVHGHWRGAKQDPVVQARNIGLVKHGYFVLAVDAFGAGERGLGKALGEYHGEMVGATLLPIGLPLSGLQVYENMRAVDYLRTRPEVDGSRIGITGASGGGNQTMYAAAWDERFAAAVPVCSVGTYQAYLGVACCMCEVVPGALTFAEESDVLALTAPRALMVVNATRDGIQFSVPEAKKSIAGALPIFSLMGKPDALKHAVFESGHDYNKEMREAAYGWFAKHLKGEGDGSPLPDPAIETEDPETMRCFPGASRPDDWMTIPKFAAREGRRLVEAYRQRPWPAPIKPRLDADRARLRDRVLGGFPSPSPLDAQMKLVEGVPRELTFRSEPGISLVAQLEVKQPPTKLALLIDLDAPEQALTTALATELRAAGWSLVAPELRATGIRAYKSDRIGRAPDHTTAEWAMWVGRPLLGQWTWDVKRTLDALEEKLGALPKEVAVIGIGPAGLVALTAGILDARLSAVVMSNTLQTFVTDAPYVNQRLGTLAPGMLREVGDVNDLGKLVQGRLVIADTPNEIVRQLLPR